METKQDELYARMMDALDGELTAEELNRLEVDLRAYPALMQEWQAMQTIDTLFRQSPVLSPAADFAQRTVAALPNRRFRLWAVGILYVLLLLSGVLPMLLGILAVTVLRPFFSNPQLLEDVWESVLSAANILATIFYALLDGAGEFVAQQPIVVGWMLVIAGIVALWGGVYRQMIWATNNASNGG
ncbi:MAG: hypothetical protein D6835_06075 [Candidatus Thermofonsia bacterium]|nr:MAG: hypothetical protein D6835_06075 [Candidatus Thermofonsia bacterium]